MSATAMSLSPGQGFCVKCLTNGHHCITDYQDPMTGKFICVFCEDGEPCPKWKEGNTQAPTKQEEKDSMDKCICSPTCDKIPQAGRKYYFGHKPKDPATKAPARRGRPPKNATQPPAAPPARRSRPVPPTWNTRDDEAPEEKPRVSLLFSSDQLNRMFAGLPLEDKNACMQLWLDKI
jgi:hypothetical protein